MRPPERPRATLFPRRPHLHLSSGTRYATVASAEGLRHASRERRGSDWKVGQCVRPVGTCGRCSRCREVRIPMAASKRGPEPGSQKAKHGGQAVREKYGPEFYSRIGKKGGEAVKEKRGPAFYAEIGKKGGESTKRQQGPEFYSRIGKKGGERGRTAPKQSQ